MAKREFIDEKEIYNRLKQLNVTNGELDDIMLDLPTFSEQEIVKPYLEKLTTKIQRLRGCSCSCTVIDDVEDIIDNLLSESEGE